MELLYYLDPMGNFGDDLNAVLWRKVLPASVWESENVILMGIGSIFNAERAPLAVTQGKRVFVIGSGAGYGPLPERWRDWTLLAVRGPLTAELVGRPELAATDAAALLYAVPEMAKLAPRRDATLLVPHHFSAMRGRWDRVAQKSGLTYVDPRWPVPKVLEYFSRAKLVIAEAMHGAIVADALRIPWIPIVAAPDALPFKWRDWTLSLNLPYRPTRVGASCAGEYLYHRDLRRKARKSGVIAPGLFKEVENSAALLLDFENRYKNRPTKTQGNRPRAYARFSAAIRSTAKSLDGFFLEQTARQLHRVAQQTPYLSKDNDLLERVTQLQEAIHRFATLAGR